MKTEKRNPFLKPDPKEIETRDLTSPEGENIWLEETESMMSAEKLLSVGEAYIETGLDEAGLEALSVRKRSDNKMIYYTTDPFEVGELKKVYELAKGKTPR
jgi:hypothetical protein